MKASWNAGKLALARGARRAWAVITLPRAAGRNAPPGRSMRDESPLRAELLSADQMEQYGARLAAAHRTSSKRFPDRLLARLVDNERVLLATCATLTASLAAKHRVTPAAEWLLDNLYFIQEQIRTARRHLPRGYSQQLTGLSEGPSRGLPRVYDIALETIAHGDGRLDSHGLERFVAAYQTVSVLSLGELWAVPIMLRLALIENLRRIAMRIASGRAERDVAVAWAGRLGDVARRDPKNLILAIADMARSDPPLTTPFVSELVRRLQGHGPALALPLTWLEQQLAGSGRSIEQLVQAGNQQQAADQVSISNSIGALRLLGTLDWHEFVEALSAVEHTLKQDPAEAYSALDQESRNCYRQVIEEVSRVSAMSEPAVARCAIDLAIERARRLGFNDRSTHVGYFLIDVGRFELERAARVRLPILGTLRRAAGRVALPVYLSAIVLLTGLLSVGALAAARATAIPDAALVLMLLPALLVTSQLASMLVNWLATLLASPRRLPRMDYREGIPQASRTIVVVPAMITSAGNIESLVHALEVRFLANRDPNLHFGLLTDFGDASEQTLPKDAALVELIASRIEVLNERYAGGVFFLFHRPRRWNPDDQIWMGHERKRGKLSDLNRLLREGDGAGFSLVLGRVGVLADVRYVITLDTDTQLPRDAARDLVATMAHPLHRPVLDPALSRVQAGYAILQPRVSASLSLTPQTRYARLQGGDPGVDPYTRTVSDVYQDLFQEGSFIGKGIYDVHAFEQALGGRFPDRRILSHDLLEGCHARSGLLSDVQLYEQHPARYGEDVNRRYRWIRGDWQLAGWLLPRVPGADGRRRRNPLSVLSRWKLFDNLRRSVVPAAMVALLLIGWIGSSAPGSWTLAVIGAALLPMLLASVLDAVRKPGSVRVRQHLAAAARAAARRGLQAAFALTTLAHEAIYSLDAILRTHWRLLVTGRRLLEWKSSTEQERTSSSGLAASWRSMWSASLLAAGAVAYLAVYEPVALFAAGPILGLWLLSPLITWRISLPRARREARLSAAQIRFLQRVARRTWAFFESVVGPDDNWLPPDNYQESRAEVLAHRTSPTNMGLSLLANLAAYDFGFIPAGIVLERSANTLATMQGLPRHRGHFFNWYDTRSLAVLPPAYISTVDSGNLAGHLLTLRQGLLALIDRPVLEARWLDGVDDTLGILEDAVANAAPASLMGFRQILDAALAARPTTVRTSQELLDRCVRCSEIVASDLDAVNLDAVNLDAVNLDAGDPDAGDPDQREARWWAAALTRQCRALRDELLVLVPWAEPQTPPLLLARGQSVSDCIPTLRSLAACAHAGEQQPAHDRQAGASAPSHGSPQRSGEPIDLACTRAALRIEAIERMAAQAGKLADMEYGFLYEGSSRLLSIGYNFDERRLDGSCYDLLASEARLAVFVAIARDQVPQESWFALGRLLTTAGGEPVLLSWSGSMFEYLMPQLVMPSYEHTLLDQSARAAVARQIEYAREHGLPWGMSESGYSTVDAELNYQYRAFGVPGLGFKRGLADDLVVAPYASAMALMVAPEAACTNLQRLNAIGAQGRFGFFEALDYTPARRRRKEAYTLVRSYMAHHQGMSLLALDHLLLRRPMQQRFASDPQFQATLLLLQEQMPRASVAFVHAAEPSTAPRSAHGTQTSIRVLDTPDTLTPQVQLLSNGRYHVMVTNAGGGYSRWKDLAVTRWREDGTRDHWGSFCYLRDVEGGAVWSVAHQPSLRRAQSYRAIFSEGRAEFRRRDGDFDLHTEIVVSPEDDIELRRVRITNRSSTTRTLELTSYAEVVLAPAAADALHPAFSNLFVQSEIVPARQAILCTRRPRAAGESSPCLFHLMAAYDAGVGEYSYESDRARFIGRGRTAASPLAMDGAGALSDTQGSVLDPVVAIRRRISLAPEKSATVDLVFGVGENREAALGLIEKYHDRHLADRVLELAWTHAPVVLRQINAREVDAQLYARLANTILYADASLRADGSVLARNRRAQPGLWGYAISGDLPIVLLRIGDLAGIELARQLIQAHAYWRLKGLAVDLVIWNEDRAGYRQLLQEQILDLVAVGTDPQSMDRPGGIFVRAADQLSEEDRVLFQTVARVVLSDKGGTLAEQVNRPGAPPVPVAALVPVRPRRALAPAADEAPPGELLLGNGIGGFTRDGREYVITTTARQLTPAPWVNVLANAAFGSVISESGQAYTWGENAHEFRLTPWHNDPITDASGEAFYLRDEDSGHYWSPTPLPRRGSAHYISRHGFGYSVFEHTEDGISSQLWVYVAVHAAMKFCVLKVRNCSGRTRRLSATGYVEWVLGDLPPRSAMHVSTEVDPNTGTVYARNPYNAEFPERVACFGVDDVQRTLTCDRTEFIGRNGSLQAPASMARMHLSGKAGSGLDPCAAIQVPFELADAQEREITFRLGLGGVSGGEDASALMARFHGPGAARRALEGVWEHWNQILGAVQVETPDESINVLSNGWLMYQTIACRMWARSGYYQSGGAFGFRDQLQDAMALVHTRPDLLRAHLLECAGRQFIEGDVQHWWHPPSGRGVRTRCSDDYLWLALATCRYLNSTGDIGVLDEPAHYLEGPLLGPGDEDHYDLPGRSEQSQTLYQHCVQAIRHALTFGEHGLPLIGTGDWNDGMNRVGVEGKGESVWLGFFLYDLLRQFGTLAQARGDADFANTCAVHAMRLREDIERHGWDGAWYRRAYFDDGTPLGSVDSAECQIDSIAQSWAVLSGAADSDRARQAMQAVDERLVRREHALIQLLDPPFDRSSHDPGYIKGYVPGVRENGGQYTHAAIWAAMAFAALGDRERAWELTTMINPANHATSREAIERYKVEPYVIAADVYAAQPHAGRGGWTWYTGSAGWMYRLIVESLLGLRRIVDRRRVAHRLHIAPCLPAHWPGLTIRYRYHGTMYHIEIAQEPGPPGVAHCVTTVTVDGVVQRDAVIDLVDDHVTHEVKVRMSFAAAAVSAPADAGV